METTNTYTIEDAKQFLTDYAAPKRDFYWRDAPPDPDNWAFTLSKHSGSGLLSESNYDVAIDRLTEVDPDQENWIDGGFGHWAVGSLDQILVRVLDDQNTITAAGLCIMKIAEDLERYSILDENHYSHLEVEAAYQNWDNAVKSYVRQLDTDVKTDIKDIIDRAYTYMVDNDLTDWECDNSDDQGAYPPDDLVKQCVDAVTPELWDMETVAKMVGTADIHAENIDGTLWLYTNTWAITTDHPWFPMIRQYTGAPYDLPNGVSVRKSYDDAWELSDNTRLSKCTPYTQWGDQKLVKQHISIQVDGDPVFYGPEFAVVLDAKFLPLFEHAKRVKAYTGTLYADYTLCMLRQITDTETVKVLNFLKTME